MVCHGMLSLQMAQQKRMMQTIGLTNNDFCHHPWWTLSLLGLVDSICHTAWPDPHHIFQTDLSNIGQKPTYCVQSFLRMRMLRLKIIWRYLVLKPPSVWDDHLNTVRAILLNLLTPTHLFESGVKSLIRYASKFFLMVRMLMCWDIQGCHKVVILRGRHFPLISWVHEAVGHRAIVMNCCSVHCTTQPGAERVWMLASACLLHLTTLYSCPNISNAFWGLQGFPEVLEVFWEFRSNLELEHSPERGEHRGQVGS